MLLLASLRSGSTTTNRVDEYIVSQGFCQELDGPRFHRRHGHRYIAVSGDEDDRQVRALRELPLELEAVQPGEGDIKQQTTRNTHARA
jgi:hypothetical protein